MNHASIKGHHCAALFVLVAMLSAAGTARAELAWKRRTIGGFTVDLPASWNGKSKSDDSVLRVTGMLHERQYNAKGAPIEIVLVRLPHDGKTLPIKLVREAATLIDGSDLAESATATDATQLIGRSDGTNTGIRARVDSAGKYMYVGVVTSARSLFNSADLSVNPWAILDRILVSFETPTTNGTSSATWKLAPTEIGDTIFYLPRGWTLMKESTDDDIRFHSPKHAKGMDYAIILESVRTTIERVRGKPILSALESVFAAKVTRIAPFQYGDRTDYVELVSFRDSAGTDTRAAIFVTRNRTRVDVAHVAASANDFWLVDLPLVGEAIHKARGVSRRELLGSWTTGRSNKFLNYYDPAGRWVDDSREGVAMSIRFDKDGHYELIYLYVAHLRATDAKIYSRERGTYRFTGLELELRPSQRKIHNDIDGKRSSELHKKGLRTTTLTVRRMGDDLMMTGARMKWLGMWPKWEENDVDTLYFSRGSPATKKRSGRAGFGKGQKK